MKKPSIKDVAEKAGVSTATVSYVINDSRGTSQETQKKVWEAVEALQYSQNLTARHFAIGKSDILGLIISDVRNPFFPEIISAFQDYALAQRLELIILNTNYDPQRTLECVKRLIGLKVSGIAVMTSEFEQSLVEMLVKNNIPSVYMDYGTSDKLISNIAIDYESGINEALTHLNELEHREIAYIGGPPALLSSRRRKNAFLESCERLNLTPVATIDADFTVKGGYFACSKLLNIHQPSALVCGNDLTAIGALHCTYDKKIKVPDEISVIGFDDILFAEYTQPSLTTVVMSRKEIGRLAFQALAEMMSSETLMGAEYQLKTYLVKRQSTAQVLTK